MAVALELQRTLPTRRGIRRIFKATFSGNYTTGGDTVDFTAAANPKNLERPIPDKVPAKAEVQFSDSAAAYIPEFVAGTTLANAKLKFYSADGTEVANGAYPAALAADDLYFSVDQSRRSA